VLEFDDPFTVNPTRVSTEPTNREILERVDQIVSLLELDRRSLTEPPAATCRDTGRINPDCFPADASNVSPAAGDTGKISPGGLSQSYVIQGSQPARISFESIVNWPIFQGTIHAHVRSLVLQKNLINDGSLRRTCGNEDVPRNSLNILDAAPKLQARSIMVDEAETALLCHKYLTLVHVKNPILDVSEFHTSVKIVLEHGLDWDEGSCLVVGLFDPLASQLLNRG